MPFIIPANTLAADGGYQVDNSCRFDDGSSAYMHRTPSAGNRRTMTLSVWIKGSSLADGSNNVLGQYNSSNANNAMLLVIEDAGKIMVWNYTTSAYTMDIRTNRLLRDNSAWYHIVVAVDTTQSTASNRVKVYVNGVQETSFSNETYPSQNLDLFLNQGVAQNIGTQRYGSTVGSPFDGYMAEFCFIDGTQNAVTDFGEFDEDSGIWKPIDVSGLTFGTNGYYLDFEDSSALGNDVSGNDNDFTTVNLAAVDQSTDTCTNNFATVSPLVVIGNTGQTYADGNLTFNASSTNWTATNSTIGASSGKWYAEFKVVTLASSTGYGHVGITGTEGITAGNFVSTDANSVGVTLDYRGSGQTYLYSAGSSVQVAGVAFSAGAIMGIAVDMDNKKFYLSQNGTYLTVGGSVGNPGSGSTGTGSLAIPSGIETFLFAVGGYSTSFKGTWNFGSPAYAISSSNADGNDYGNFEYAVPSGYYSLNTKNLAEYG